MRETYGTGSLCVHIYAYVLVKVMMYALPYQYTSGGDATGWPVRTYAARSNSHGNNSQHELE